MATESHGKTQNIRTFFPCLPWDSGAIYHASGVAKCHSIIGSLIHYMQDKGTRWIVFQ
jgi:hypothetical protein